ncbi:unnamed protein product [Miscanthus lutarioriparius]|uniref:Serine aminopeptidase S33 domain-containing protein n=1 Tax=Miscanthus lutarioriparius TaxID=422564 RepID=A0A811R324_9POAL|nr:unnamed protein product [Miscanthus lutarioriparius]
MGGVTSSVASKMAFFPPDPPSYGVVDEEEEPAADDASSCKVATRRVATTGVWWSVGVEAGRVRTRRGSEIIAVYVRHPGASLTVLFSHGNAADLGKTYGIFVELNARLHVNLMGYDYSGYGQSSGKPSEANTFADIEAAYKCLVDVYGTREEDIVLYGQSVGSGPTLDLAVRFDRVRAVVLHSPILSGLRVMYSVKKTYWFGIYKNIDKIRHVQCPVLVIHGTKDDVVDCSHGKRLWELCLCQHKYEPLWIEGGDHGNLEKFPVYIRHLKKFLSTIKKLPSEKDEHETSAAENRTQPDSEAISEAPSRMISRRLEPSKKNTIHEEHTLSTEEKARSSTDRRSRRSVDCFDSILEHEQPEKPRKSFDRIGEKIRAMGLCNVDCFKEPPDSGELSRGR